MSAPLPRFLRLSLLAAAIGTLLVATSILAARRADRQLREDLIRQTRIVAMAINPQRVEQLRGDSIDLSSRHYIWLKDQLSAIRKANPLIRFAYLLARDTGGQILFLVDSEPDDSPDCSPPGQLYPEVSEPIRAAFEANLEASAGPAQDRWGTWVTAVVPLPNTRFRGSPVLVGVDVDAAQWGRAVALRAALPAALAAVAILLTLLAFSLQRSRRKLRERQALLLASEERFIRLAEQSRTVVWEIDAQGLYTYFSPAVEPILGYRPDELVGKLHFYDLHPEQGREEFKRAAFELLARKQPFVNFENAAQTKRGTVVWLLTSGFPILDDQGGLLGYRGNDIDITLRKRSEEQVRALLAESNQSRQALLGILEDQTRAEADRRRLTAAIEQSAEIVVVTDPQGVIQYVNPAFEAATGFSREEAIGQTPRILKSGKQDDAFYQALWKTLSGGKTWRGRFINRRKDGALYSEDALISPVCDPAGRIINYVAVKHDITEHLRLSEQLQQSQKMDSIGRLAGGVAHDFNNMLGVILGHTEIAMERGGADHPLRADLVEIRKAAERSAALTRQLLAFARRQTVTPKVLDLNETVDGMLKMLRRLIGENIDLLWQPKARLWPVKIDPSQIDQILANLCVNARDAISGVGQITIETANVSLDAARAALCSGAAPGDYVRLDVRDNGCGMDAETISHIFEPFFSTKETGAGIGLGLATVYGIVQQNNGFIQVQSEPGRGTAFHIHLPRHRGAAESPPHKGSASAPLARSSETILLVEDEPAILKIAAQMIEGLGYTVMKASSPAEALRLAKTHADHLHLLMTDVVMPEMNGRDLAKKILAIQPHLKCLFMSGYTADVIARNGVLEKGVHFIEKPFLKHTLAAQIREALDSPPAAPPPAPRHGKNARILLIGNGLHPVMPPKG